MTENIVIEFTSNTEGLTTAEQQVQQLDKSTAEQFTKTNATLKERDAAMDRNVAGIDLYTKKLKDAEKAAVGAFSTKGIKEYQDAVSKSLKDTIVGFQLSDKEAKKFFQNLQAQAKKGLLAGGTDDEMKQYQASLNAATLALKELGEGSDEAGGKTQSLKARLRELKQELAVIDDPSDPKFRAMSIEAAELEDRISDVNQQIKLLSSDTRNLDAGIQAVQGIAGAFAAAQGALALFGAEEGEVQQTLLKVNAAMSIMQGIQQVGALLDKNSALNIFLIKTLRLQQAASTTAVAVADVEAAAGAEALAAADTQAAVAQQGLNAAMAANPAGILILSLGVLVGLIEIFIGDTEAAAKAQGHLNNSLNEGIKINNGFLDAIKSSREKNRAELEKDNASAAALRANDIKSLEEQVKQTKIFEDSKVQAYQDADKRLRAMAEGRVKFDKDEAEQLQKTKEAFEGLQKQRFSLEDQLQVAQIGHEAATFQERLKNHTAFIEASVLQTREGSRAELVAQIAAIRAREQEELQSQAHLPGEIAKIRAQADRDAQNVRQQIRVFDLNQEKLYADAKLQKAIEGGQEELNSRVNLLRIQANIEIAGAQGNSAKIADIKAKAAKDEFELIRTYNRKIQDDTVNARIAAMNSQISRLTIAGADATNIQLLNARKRLIDDQVVEEKLGVERSIDTSENKRIRIQAIDDKALADKKQLEKDKAAAEISSSLGYQNAYEQLQADRAQRILNNDKSSYGQKKKAEDDYYNHSISILQNELIAEEDRYNNGLISYEEYQTKKLQIQDQKEALSFQHTQNLEAKRKAFQKQIIDAAFNVAQQISDAEFEIDAAKRQADLDKALSDLDIRKQKELDVKNLTEQQKADIDKRYKAKEAQIKRVAWEKDRQAQIRQAEINGLLAVTNALATVKPFIPAALIAASLAAITAGIQVGKIKSMPTPAFKTGVIKLDGPGTETSDSILARLSRNESVIRAAMTRKWEPALQAINDDKFEQYLTSVKLPEMLYPNITMAPVPQFVSHETSGRGFSIDYGKLGKEIARNVPSPSHTQINMDENGFSKHIIDKGNRITLRNQRYKL